MERVEIQSSASAADTTQTPEQALEALEANKQQTATDQQKAAPGYLEGNSQESGSLIAGKYKSVDDLVAAHKALETKLGELTAKTQPAPQEDTSNKQADGLQVKTPATTEEAKETLAEKNLDFDKYLDEYAQGGNLSEASYAELQQAGINKQTVDNYIAGQQAISERIESAVHQSVGGKDAYGQMIEWAKSSLDAEQIATFNQAVASQDMNVVMLAVDGLHSRFVKANGQAPQRTIQGGSNPASSAIGFANDAEFQQAIADSRYHTDPNYREMVIKKLQASKLW